jgi:dTDP-4-amino-4,6-dideoxygalactose transaminase
MRTYGLEDGRKAYWPGLNAKMSELHAVVGLASLERLPGVLAERVAKARVYVDRLECATSFRVLHQPTVSAYTYCAIPIVVPCGLMKCRDTVVTALAACGIESPSHFYLPLHEQPHFRNFVERPLPVTEDLSRRVIELPFFTSMTAAQIDSVVAALQVAERAIGHRHNDLLSGLVDGSARGELIRGEG